MEVMLVRLCLGCSLTVSYQSKGPIRQAEYMDYVWRELGFGGVHVREYRYGQAPKSISYGGRPRTRSFSRGEDPLKDLLLLGERA